MSGFIKRSNLNVAPQLLDFIEQEVLPALPISANDFWLSLSTAVEDLGSENRALLVEREVMQKQIDKWCFQNKDNFNSNAYKSFLQKIGYLVEEQAAFQISTADVDEEISCQAGPQLVVPTSNARFALNASNARWGSLYDALYGSNVIEESDGAERGNGYNPVRGEKVITFARTFLDEHFPLQDASHKQGVSHKNVVAYQVDKGFRARLEDGQVLTLKNSSQYLGYQGKVTAPTSILLSNNGLRVAIEIDATSAIGKTDKAGVKDLTLEAAVTTIQDFEDSVAAVDAQDKVGVYRNWLGLMKGDLSDSFEKAGKQMTRTLQPDRVYTASDGAEIILHGRSLLFCRNVGHLMTNPAIIDSQGREIQEGIMDAFISSLIAMHDLNKTGQLSNSRRGSIYIVKPKMHGPKEAAFANKLFNRVEDELGLSRHTIKIGVMDEERRTTVNLKECIRQVKDRVVFINTGFLDRTGDEIHTSMQLGVMDRKAQIKQKAWISAYEDWNVDIGLECGLAGKAQIGKGMWAMPDEMAQMLEQKIAHPQAGANTAWVPSPIGATLHAMHYHKINVVDIQEQLAQRQRASLDEILSVPFTSEFDRWSAEDIQAELDNNAQGILGYVVRWIDQGVGCSKVPDINNVGLMEDRATLRISSQHIANWLEHGITNAQQVRQTFERMAKVVDQQNVDDSMYKPMSANFGDSLAFQAALDLCLKGKSQPSGYTEPLLHAYRLKLKANA